MSAIGNALQRASRPLDWSYPCLIWIADYLLDATGTDFAADWRQISFAEATAGRELVRLAAEGEGPSPVEKALDGLAKRFSWQETEIQMQGAVMIGVYRDLNAEGTPAIFDGQDRWVCGRQDGGYRTIAEKPARMWEVPVAAR